MRFLSFISLFAVLLTAGALLQAQSPAAPASARWLLDFESKSTNDLYHDKRFASFLRTNVSTRPLAYWVDSKPSIPAQDALEFLGGPSDIIHIVDHRFLTASACVPHDCTERGLLWVDTDTGNTVFAPSVADSTTPALGDGSRYHLFLFTNCPFHWSNLPPTLLNDIATWSAQPDGDGTSHSRIGRVTLVEPDGTQIQLTAAEVHAWTPNQAAGKHF